MEPTNLTIEILNIEVRSDRAARGGDAGEDHEVPRADDRSVVPIVVELRVELAG
jgi:hypothetical protein